MMASRAKRTRTHLRVSAIEEQRWEPCRDRADGQVDIGQLHSKIKNDARLKCSGQRRAAYLRGTGGGSGCVGSRKKDRGAIKRNECERGNQNDNMPVGATSEKERGDGGGDVWEVTFFYKQLAIKGVWEDLGRSGAPRAGRCVAGSDDW